MFKNKTSFLIGVPLLIPAVCVVASLFGNTGVLEVFLLEDKILESASFFIWMGLFVLYLLYAFRLKKEKLVFAAYIFVAVVSFVVGMEEISWGQRIFNVETPEFFAEKNLQGEMNFHNIKVGDKSLNKIVLHKTIPVFFIFYFILFPVLYTKGVKWVRKIVDYFHIPLFPIECLWMILAYVFMSFVMVEHGRKGELTEFYIPYVILVLFALRYWHPTENQVGDE